MSKNDYNFQPGQTSFPLSGGMSAPPPTAPPPSIPPPAYSPREETSPIPKTTEPQPTSTAFSLFTPPAQNESHLDENPEYQGSFTDYLNLKEKDVRKNFLKKVLAIIALQLLMTFAGVFATVYAISTSYNSQNSTSYSSYAINNALSTIFSPTLIWFSIILNITSLICVTCCCRTCLKKVPHNFIFLFIWTLTETHLVSLCAFRYEPTTICLAIGATAGITALIALLVWCTNFDFSKLLPVMSMVLLVWVLVTAIGFFFGFRWNVIVKSSIGCTIFTIFLAIDLKMVVGGGKHKYEADDYILAALNIYMDIIQIFLYILQCLGKKD